MSCPPEQVTVNGRELSAWELHVLRTAVATYLADIVTGERVIITDQELWVKHLSNVSRYLYQRSPEPEQEEHDDPSARPTQR